MIISNDEDDEFKDPDYTVMRTNNGKNQNYSFLLMYLKLLYFVLFI